MTDDYKPRSMKLTMEHRRQIARNAMKAWRDNNPPPHKIDGSLFAVKSLKAINARAKKKGKLPENSLAKRIRDARAFLAAGTPLHSQFHRVYATNHLLLTNEDDTPLTLDLSYLPRKFLEEVGLDDLIVSSKLTTAPTHDKFANNYVIYVDEQGKRIDDVAAAEEAGTTVYRRIEDCEILSPTSHFTDVLDTKSHFEQTRLTRKNAEHSRQGNKLHAEIEDTLMQFNTTNQLREGWLEIVQFLPPHLADPAASIKLPILAVSLLNERLLENQQ